MLGAFGPQAIWSRQHVPGSSSPKIRPFRMTEVCARLAFYNPGTSRILDPTTEGNMWSYISPSRFSSSLGVSPHISPTPFLSLRLSVPPSLSQSLSLTLSLSLSLRLSVSLHFSAGSLWVSLSITPWFPPNSALWSQFLLLFGHLRLHEWHP